MPYVFRKSRYSIVIYSRLSLSFTSIKINVVCLHTYDTFVCPTATSNLIDHFLKQVISKGWVGLKQCPVGFSFCFVQRRAIILWNMKCTGIFFLFILSSWCACLWWQLWYVDHIQRHNIHSSPFLSSNRQSFFRIILKLL